MKLIVKKTTAKDCRHTFLSSDLYAAPKLEKN